VVLYPAYNSLLCVSECEQHNLTVLCVSECEPQNLTVFRVPAGRRVRGDQGAGAGGHTFLACCQLFVCEMIHAMFITRGKIHDKCMINATFLGTRCVWAHTGTVSLTRGKIFWPELSGRVSCVHLCLRADGQREDLHHVGAAGCGAFRV